MSSAIGSHRILSGPLGPSLLRFGTPLAIGMGLQTVFNLVDAYLIGQLQPEVAGPALGAIGICDQLAAIGSIVSYGMTVATGVFLSRRQGQGDQPGIQRVAVESLVLIGILSILFGGLGVLGSGLLIRDLVGAKGQVADLSVPYLRVMMGGSFSIFFLLHLTGMQRALGSSKTPVLLLLGANLLNFFLAVIFVFGPGPAPALLSFGPPLARALGVPRMELVGAAWATLLARSLFLVPALLLLARRFGVLTREALWSTQARAIGRIVSLGWPSSAQLVVRISAMLLTHALVARAFTTELDQTASTALGIVFRLETMALFVGLGWGSAAQTFVGQNLGAENPARAKKSGWLAASYNSAMMLALALLYLGWGRSLVGIFDDDAAVVQKAVEYFHWVAPSYVGLGIGIVLGSAIQGAGATLQALRLDLGVVLVLQLPLSLAVVSAPGATATALWRVVALTYLAFALSLGVSYRRGRFLRAALA